MTFRISSNEDFLTKKRMHTEGSLEAHDDVQVLETEIYEFGTSSSVE